jgi:hypothetical protein
MTHLEGWLFVPMQGQRRFGVTFEQQGDAKIVPRQQAYDLWFTSSPSTAPTCQDLRQNDYAKVDLVNKAVRTLRLRYRQHDSIRPGTLLTQPLEKGVKVVFYHPPMTTPVEEEKLA